MPSVTILNDGGTPASITSTFVTESVTYNYTPAAVPPATVPEPSSIALLAAGLCGLGLAGRRAAANRTGASRPLPGA